MAAGRIHRAKSPDRPSRNYGEGETGAARLPRAGGGGGGGGAFSKASSSEHKKRGALNGRPSAHMSALPLAARGTVFLDENWRHAIGDQAKLLPRASERSLRHFRAANAQKTRVRFVRQSCATTQGP